MILESLQHLNWVDLLYMVLFLRVMYISLNTGFSIEIFKFLGILCAVYVGLHYYTDLSDIFQNKSVQTEKSALQFIDLVCYIMLVVAGCLFFLLIRFAVTRYIKIDTVTGLNRWGGFLVGLVRGYLLIGLISYGLAASSIVYFKDMLRESLIGPSTFHIAPDAYRCMWNSVASKFAVNEKFNTAVNEVEKDFTEK